MPATYLLGRVYDPLLGVFTGVLAYHLHEKNPRSRPPPGHTLQELASWQWERSRQARAARIAAQEAAHGGFEGSQEWEQIKGELAKEGERGGAVPRAA